MIRRRTRVRYGPLLLDRHLDLWLSIAEANIGAFPLLFLTTGDDKTDENQQTCE